MCCGRSGGASPVAYRVAYTDADGKPGEAYAQDMGGYRMIRTNVEQSGGKVTAAVQVTRSAYDKWVAQQQT